MGASIVGSIVGLGGGFVAVPVLRLYFHFTPAMAAGTSLVLVLANSLSAGAQYLKQKRIAFHLAIPIAAASVPGSVLGAYLSTKVSGPAFDILYAVLLVGIAIDVVWSSMRANSGEAVALRHFDKLSVNRPASLGAQGDKEIKGGTATLLGAGFIVGLVSSLFGIGGGVIVVPLLLYATSEELHTITATSTAILAMTVPVGIAAHAIARDLEWNPCLAMASGGLMGGYFGAILSTKISSHHLRLFLAIAMLLAAGGMGLRHVF